ncbi:MAG: hypothetical protein GY854_07960 [Deltaproteobacteria bacterium]|nr:hypothetical protein [Deltaproteobacteria bacterium]
MLKFLLDKFKHAPGPLKQPRLVAGDIIEEIIDLAEYYIKRSGHIEPDQSWTPSPEAEQPDTSQTDASATSDADSKKTVSTATTRKTKANQPPRPTRTLEVPKALEAALEIPANHKKQEFKVLAILWDALERELGLLSSKEVSQHGVKLGMSIRHENVRKVIRMRLDKQVEIRTEQAGSGSIYRYRISPAGIDYFVSKYLNSGS